MSTIMDFENAPVGATATHADGSRAMKMDDIERRWVTSNGVHLDDEEVEHRGYTRDPLWPAPESAFEALDLAWNLAHEVKEGQVIPKGTPYLMKDASGLREYTAQHDVKILPELVPIIRTVEPLPEPEPEWLNAPAVLAETSMCPDRKVWIPESGGVWKCSCCRDEIHWYELVDVNPLYPKETEA